MPPLQSFPPNDIYNGLCDARGFLEGEQVSTFLEELEARAWYACRSFFRVCTKAGSFVISGDDAGRGSDLGESLRYRPISLDPVSLRRQVLGAWEIAVDHRGRVSNTGFRE